MRDSQLNKAERRVQPSFRLATLLGMALLPLLIWQAQQQFRRLPDRQPLPERTLPVRFAAEAPGVWSVAIADPRWGGASALAIDDDRLLVLTDSGVLVRLPRPGEGREARLGELPDGPGPPARKRNRDSEALVRDVQGRGWWVSFEFRHSLWLYDPQFGTALRRVPLTGFGWSNNGGVEAILAGGGWPLLIPESGTEVLVADGRGWRRLPLAGATGSISDAVRLPDGRTIVALRELTARGLRNRLAWLDKAGPAYRVQPFATLPLGAADNVEGLAAEPLANGAVRLWAVTDNDGSDWRTTKLIALRIAPPTD